MRKNEESAGQSLPGNFFVFLERYFGIFMKFGSVNEHLFVICDYFEIMQKNGRFWGLKSF